MSADSSITLTNTGTAALLLQAPVIDNSSFVLLAPPAGDFPILLQPDSTLRLRLRVTHSGPGSRSGLLELRSDEDGCDILAQLILSANAREALLFVGDLGPFPSLRCAGERADTTLLLRNDGDVPLTITALSSSLPAFQILSPATPFVLGVGQQVTVRLRFAPGFAGVFQGTLSIEHMPCGAVHTRTLEGVLDLLQLSTGALDFGLRRASTLPVVATTMLHNTGTQPITVTGALDIPPFRIVGGLPVVILPGDSVDIDVEFTDGGTDGAFAQQLRIEHAPSCDTVFLSVQGRRVTARVLVRTDTIVAAPSDVIELPIYLSNAENLQFFGATSMTVNLRYQSSIMVPLFEPEGVLVDDERVIRLDLPFTTDENDVALRLPFMVTLGTTDISSLLLSDVVAVGGELTIDVQHGQLTLEEICREGGDRFFDASSAVALRPNRPNPFNPITEITFDVIEAAPTQLEVYDALGRRVALLLDRNLDPGSYTRTFHADGLPSGIYIAVLKTPTVTKIQRMLLVK